MGKDTDTMEVNQQIHVKKKDTGDSLQHEECGEVSSGSDMLSKPY